MTLKELVDDVTIQAEVIKVVNVETQAGIELKPAFVCSGEILGYPAELADMEVLYIYPENGNALIIEVTEAWKNL